MANRKNYVESGTDDAYKFRPTSQHAIQPTYRFDNILPFTRTSRLVQNAREIYGYTGEP